MARLMGILLCGLVFLGVGAQRYLAQAVHEEGPATLHLDDAEPHTLAAWPWVRITHAHLCTAMARRFCADGSCLQLVPLISPQGFRNCTGAPAQGKPCRCSDVAVALPDEALTRLRGSGGAFSTEVQVMGVRLEPGTASARAMAEALGNPRALIVLEGAQPPAERLATALMPGGLILVLWGAWGLSWRARRRQ